MILHRALWTILPAVCAVCLPSIAFATPRPLPFTYTTDTLDQGSAEIEQYADLTPVAAANISNGGRVWYLATQYQTEFEYGITDRLELGLYFTYVPSLPSDQYAQQVRMTEGTGVKQRLRYVFAPPDQWPIDVGVYGELVENDHEFELEGKILLQRRFGRLRVDSNLWAEYELYYVPQKDVVLNPTLAATYQITPSVHVGLESWLRVEFPSPAPSPRPYALGPVVYVGPTFLVSLGRLWWSTGIYGRVSQVDHSMGPGEPYGPIWARTVVGFEL
jgi:hypothetical protein